MKTKDDRLDLLWATPILLSPTLERNPRIPVTASMLYTYAHMRGTYSQVNDPLHGALYPGPSRNHSSSRLCLHLITRRMAIEDHPKGVIYFWDPMISVQSRPTQLQLSVGPLGFTAAPLTFDEYISKNPPSVGINHYKGDMVYANFGYILVGDQWVDPEGEGSLFNAYYMSQSEDLNNELSLPNLQHLKDPGPYIMSPEEEDEFYKRYVEDVTDDKDGEGDPRALRISPATFARWAEGAIEGERYEETASEPPSHKQTMRPSLRDGCVKSRKINSEMQFDIETGSMLSGIYQPSENPSLLESAQGVDIIRPPANFSYSYPQIALELERQAFGLAWQDHRQESSLPTMASTPEVFTSEHAYGNLTIPIDPVGEYEYRKKRYNILRMRRERERTKLIHYETQLRAQAAAHERIKLGREVFFLEHRINGDKPLDHGPHSCISSHSPSVIPTSGPLKRRQYQRYLEESEEQEKLMATKRHLVSERLTSDYLEIYKDIQRLEKTKNRLLSMLDIGTTEDIPDLFPTGTKSSNKQPA